jgi:hypothetical protein
LEYNYPQKAVLAYSQVLRYKKYFLEKEIQEKNIEKISEKKLEKINKILEKQ